MERYKCDTSAVEFDPMCDKENPQMISFEDVSAAAFRIQSGIVKTPCVKSQLSTTYGMQIYLKNDFLQHTGSFKERGARNALLLLSSEAKRQGVISASLGNHSQGLSYHANLLDIPATVVKIVCETSGKGHTEELQKLVSSAYKDCYFLRQNSADAYRVSLTDSLIHVNDMKTKKGK